MERYLQIVHSEGNIKFLKVAIAIIMISSKVEDVEHISLEELAKSICKGKFTEKDIISYEKKILTTL